MKGSFSALYRYTRALLLATTITFSPTSSNITNTKTLINQNQERASLEQKISQISSFNKTYEIPTNSSSASPSSLTFFEKTSYRTLSNKDTVRKNVGLILVDMQEKFLFPKPYYGLRDPSGRPVPLEHSTPASHEEIQKKRKIRDEFYEKQNRIEYLIKSAQEENIPIYVVLYEGYGEILHDIKNILDQGEYRKFPREGHNSGFQNTNLDSALKENNTKIVVISGLRKEACVLETAKDAHKLGYTIATSYGILLGDGEVNPLAWYAYNTELYGSVRKLVKKYFKQEE